MPSGAKKRKAAKKKKESQAQLHGSTDSIQGTDHEVKSQDERDSDVGDESSPQSQDQEEHENPFSKGADPVHEEKDPSSVPSFPAETSCNSGREIDGLSTDGLMKNAGLVGLSNDRNGQDSTVREIDRSSGVSDKNKHEEKDSSAVPSLLAESNSNLGEEIDGLSKDGLMMNAKFVDVSIDRNHQDSTVREIDSSSGVSDKNVQEEALNSVTGSAPEDDVVRIVDFASFMVTKIPVDKDVSMVPESSTQNVDKLVVYLPELASQVSKSSSIKEQVIDVEKGAPATGTELTFTRIDDDEYPPADMIVKVASSREALPPSQVLVATPIITDEYDKDSEISECSEKKPLVASAPQAVRRTSWLSCCGILELLSGSN